jgi:hypothetical protein
MEAFMADLEVQPKYLSGRAEKETVEGCSNGGLFCLSCLVDISTNKSLSGGYCSAHPLQ